jgi:hypothetical protein
MSKINTAELLRLRATSAASRDKSLRRSAQDDGFVGVLAKNILNKSAPSLMFRPFGICCFLTSSVRCRGYLCAGAEPEEFDGWLSGLFEVDVGVRGEVIGTQHVGFTGVLHAQLRADKGQALALNFTPDLFMARKVWVRFAELQREDLHGDDSTHRGEAVVVVEEAVRDVRPVTTCSRVGKRRFIRWLAVRELIFVLHLDGRQRLESGIGRITHHVGRQLRLSGIV